MPSNKTLTSVKVQRQLVKLMQPSKDAVYMENRNPRNLEMMRIGYRPNGFHLERPGKCYWNKLILNKTPKGLTAQVKHYTGPIVLQASTEEWWIAKQLYKPYDTSAYINFGRVFAQRCLEAGLIEMECEAVAEAVPNGKLEKFLNELQNGGVKLTESPRYVKYYAADHRRMDKPWNIKND